MVTIPLSLAIAAGGFALMKVASDGNNLGRTNYAIPTRHPVTPEMVKAASALKLKPAPKFQLVDHESRQVGSADLASGKPSVLFFVKDECPCSIEAQPIFNNLARAFGGDAQFFGVTDADPAAATQFVQANVVPFRMICDPRKGLMKSFHMEASASMVLLDGKGNVAQAWAGYSQDALRQLNVLLGTLSGSGVREFDDRDAPKTLTAGCAYF